MYIGDEDRELRVDEQVTEAARQAYAHITAPAPGPVVLQHGFTRMADLVLVVDRKHWVLARRSITDPTKIASCPRPG
ncbi:hypothetical protein C7C46_09365 [Streptomyces tateyamensis]|uniref:Uncharacterized protein n=1 Tax=Streptomyces tateyamensis TaxID=565073 RepID=A0A2V4NL67_9ACTN|nr:hypothetical protein [Streptomyces tateyamensis]PYC83200.1 hypothetical protein C7C46_09365 [Streptomyces tateyamensis]